MVSGRLLFGLTADRTKSRKFGIKIAQLLLIERIFSRIHPKRSGSGRAKEEGRGALLGLGGMGLERDGLM
ncbi:MAG: hypothetical protein ACI4SV_01430, partial [Duodenibacillus sp.]